MARAPSNIRLAGLAPATPNFNNEDIHIEDADPDADKPVVNDNGETIHIEHGDGSITISLDGPLSKPKRKNKGEWFDDLCDEIDAGELARISDDLLRSISDDLQTRKDWIEQRATGIKLLGLKMDVPNLQGASDGAPVEGMSRVRHPLLLEAVLRFQANARSEMLPTDGPVKIRNDDTNADLKEDQTANALEQDLNHYLTSVATEYYPDTDRMLLMLGFGGTSFKKVYYCPLRNRPVSETVDADDLIVNNSSTDLMNARRVTHRVYMRPSTVKRLQILGVYRDINLGDPRPADLDSVQREEKDQQGQSQNDMNPLDRDREIYECYCELDIKGFEHKWNGEASGLDIPYRVTIDVSSREIVSIVRNYEKPEDDKLPVQRRTFVKYTFVPGLGFYDIGLLHILGNTTNALTAAWREILDAGMFANFPGFLIAKSGARQQTNIFRVQPGGGAQVDTNGVPIKDAIMPLPYKEAGPGLVNFTQMVAETGMRIGGTSEQQVGEGRADAPVGTTLAMIEQATKVLNAVHKRMHASQAEEFQLLTQVFREHPHTFWQQKNKSDFKWDEQTFINAIDNHELVPQADPNTASHGQRVMKIVALKQLQAANADMYDAKAVDTAALQAMGWSNPEQFFNKSPQNGKGSLEIMKEEEKLKIEQQKADADTMDAKARTQDANTRAQEVGIKAQQGAYAPKGGLGDAKPEKPETDPIDVLNAKAKLMDAETKRHALALDAIQMHVENENRDLDRQAEEHQHQISLAKDIMLHPGEEKEAVAGTKAVDKELKDD